MPNSQGKNIITSIGFENRSNRTQLVPAFSANITLFQVL